MLKELFDIQKTIGLITGGLLDSKQTWANYLEENRDWKETAVLLTGPLILASVLLSMILGWIFNSHAIFYRGGAGGVFLGLIAAVIGIAIASFVFSFFAGVFKGNNDFNKGFAALSFAAIPGYVGSVLGTVPYIGLIASLALFVLGVVLLYKIIPTYLEVPEEKRVVHFLSSLMASFVLMMIVSTLLGLGGNQGVNLDYPGNGQSANYGMLGEVGRQAALAEQAGNDRYSPPEDGYVTEDQMAVLLVSLQKTAEYRARQKKKMEQLDKDMQGKKEMGLADLGKLTSGMGAIMGTANAEMEVVKSGGGNWAEHIWIKNQLRVASIQKDLNDAVKHNYQLYKKYAEQLGKYGLSY